MNDGGIQWFQQIGQYLPEIEKMGRYASDSGTSFADAPAGNHIAVCVRLIDLGTQHGTYEGKPTIRNQVLVTWELSNELMDDGRPYTIGRFYTNSLSEKANLRPDLEAWRGRAFTVEELNRFDLQNILGKACMLQVVHTDKNKARVASVAQLPKGMIAPVPHNPLVAFWIEEWDQDTFDAFPDGIKKIIAASDEYKNRGTNRDKAMDGIAGMNDDVPF